MSQTFSVTNKPNVACLKRVSANNQVQVISINYTLSGSRRVARGGCQAPTCGATCDQLRPFSKPASPCFIPTSARPLFCAVRRPDGPECSCLCKPGPAPCRTPAPHSARATGDPRDSLLARETNQPQDPGCLGANSKARIICLAHMPVGSTDLEDTSGLLPGHELHTAMKKVAESQRTWQRTRRWESVRGDRGPYRCDSPKHDARTKNPPQNITPAQDPLIMQRCERNNCENAHLLLRLRKTSKSNQRIPLFPVSL